MYTKIDFKTKKAMKEEFANGMKIEVFQPGPFSKPSTEYNGTFCIEGPHYPKPHTWYSEVIVTNGVITKIRG